VKGFAKIVGLLLLPAVFYGFLAEASTENKNKKEIGKEIYKEHCQVCHGENGDGKTFVANVLQPQPRNFKNPLIIDSLKRNQMIYSVINGRPGTGMMPWKLNLTANEIDAVVHFIRSEFMGN
jgi:mono/diheme cytochrome c family protein